MECIYPSLDVYKKDKAFAIYPGELCSSFVLFDRVFRSLSMTSILESIHQVMKLLVSIPEPPMCIYVTLSFAFQSTRFGRFLDLEIN